MIVVEAGHPLDPQPKALLEQSHALMTSLFPRDACHFLDFDKLTAPHIRFLIAREGDVAAGTGVLAVLDGYGEVKSMFTDPNARGNGVAAAILRALEDLARGEGLPWLRLETGTGLDAAHRLYERHGFTKCDAFGDYERSDFSLFFEKELR